MSRHVIVDGFNVIRRDPDLSGLERLNFYGAQAKLNERLARYRRYTAHQITVVYDGGRGEHVFRQRLQQDGIQVIYSAHGETADEVIVDLVAKNPGQRSSYLVITADRALASACRAEQVEVALPEELLRHSRPRPMVSKQADAWHGKKEEQGWSGHTKKKGNPRRQPKSRRGVQGLW